MSVSSESDDDDDKVILKEESSCADEANNGINLGENGKLKKGPWTPDEDAILIEYVTKNGEGNWNAVQKNSGLARCGKSCRLRWANHLRPDLKKGAFTQEEENLVVELHAKMGNKWAQMANELPGRTDNEIKNFWNTRIKRRQRHGLPIYPDDIFSELANENQEIDDMNAFSSGENTHNHPNIIDPVDTIDIPEFKTESFKRMKQYIPSQLNSLLDIPTSSLLPPQALHPSSYPRKRFCVPESFCPGLNPNIGSLQISQPFTFSHVFDENSTSSIFSTNPPVSDPAWPMKPELPSLQTQMDNWITPPSSQLPPLESVDTFPPNEFNQPSNHLPRNNSLFDAGFYGSNMKKTNSDFAQQVSHASDMVVGDVFDTSSQDIHETEWDQFDEPLSPSDRSSPIFSDGTPISGTSFDEFQSAKIFAGYKVQEAKRLVPVKYDYKAETVNMMNFYKPRKLRDSDCFGSPDPTKDDHYGLKDAIGEMFLDDCS